MIFGLKSFKCLRWSFQKPREPLQDRGDGHHPEMFEAACTRELLFEFGNSNSCSTAGNLELWPRLKLWPRLIRGRR